MVRKTNKRFYNPFPREPSNIGFLKGKLVYDEKALSTKSFAAGEGFVVSWHCEDGGYMSVHHKEEPQRVLWSTLRGHAFVGGALGNDVVQESRGSFSIHDTAELLLTHQTIEQINVVWPQEDSNESINERSVSYTSSFQRNANAFFHEASSAPEDGDSYKIDTRGPAVLVTGCLYNDPKIAACHIKHYLVSQSSDRGPFYDINRSKFTQVGVRYWLFFGEKRNHHLGFSLKLEQPVKQAPDLLSLELFHPQVSSHGSLQALSKRRHINDYSSYQVDQMLWIWSQEPLSAFERRGFSNATAKLIQPLATLKRLIVNDMFKRTMRVASEEQMEKSSLHVLDLHSYDSNKPPNAGDSSKGQILDCRLNRVTLTYAADEDEQFFGFGEQFSFFNLKGRRVPIMVQEQGLGRGDQPITAAVNLVAERY